MDALSARHIEGRGTPEAAWLASPLLQDMPRATLPALVGGARRLVVIAPHPDDEVLGCGGLMAMAHRHGMEVVVVAVTDGEHCYPASPTWPPAALATARHAELVSALAELGLPATAIVRLGIVDGAVAANIAALRAALLGVVSRDDLVLVTWSRDGHPDHEACAEAAMSVARERAARIRQYPVWGWHWAHPDDMAAATTAPLRLDLDAAALAGKARAIACFASQLADGPVSPDPVLPAHVIQRFGRTFEVFFE